MAYYFTGDAGLGPTRVYRDAERDGPDIWAFPILHMGKEASLEEMGFDDVPHRRVRDWLLAVTDFTVRQHTARLVYAHPYGAERFFGNACEPGWTMPTPCRQKAASAGTP